MKKSAFAGSFEGLRAAKGAMKPVATKETQIPCGDDNKKEVAAAPAGRKVSKKGNPDFEQVTIYIRKDTHKAAKRMAEDDGALDFSDLCEILCAGYVARLRI